MAGVEQGSVSNEAVLPRTIESCPISAYEVYTKIWSTRQPHGVRFSQNVSEFATYWLAYILFAQSDVAEWNFTFLATRTSCIECTRTFSLTWPAHMQIYWNKTKCLHKKRVQIPDDWFGTPTWPPFHCFRTPIWLPWCHVKTLYNKTAI